jgi:hypothetical protein
MTSSGAKQSRFPPCLSCQPRPFASLKTPFSSFTFGRKYKSVRSDDYREWMRGRRNWREARARNARAVCRPLSLLQFQRYIRLLTYPSPLTRWLEEADRGVNFTQFNSRVCAELVGEFKLWLLGTNWPWSWRVCGLQRNKVICAPHNLAGLIIFCLISLFIKTVDSNLIPWQIRSPFSSVVLILTPKLTSNLKNRWFKISLFISKANKTCFFKPCFTKLVWCQWKNNLSKFNLFVFCLSLELCKLKNYSL